MSSMIKRVIDYYKELLRFKNHIVSNLAREDLDYFDVGYYRGQLIVISEMIEELESSFPALIGKEWEELKEGESDQNGKKDN